MLEMMAVVAVVGILALLAIPSYMDRIVRSQIKEALSLADIAKQPPAASWSPLRRHFRQTTRLQDYLPRERWSAISSVRSPCATAPFN